jgi:Family of unknown function (DUF5681)
MELPMSATSINYEDRSASQLLSDEAHDSRAGATRSDIAAHHATDCSVGYGRPPIHSRFKPGQSGNPKGRPKGSRNVRTELKEVYTDTISINVGDKKIRVTRATALLLKQLERAMKGDERATQAAIKNAKELGVFDEPKTEKASVDDRHFTEMSLEELRDLIRRSHAAFQEELREREGLEN